MTSLRLTPTSKIYVAGHRGLVGSAIVRALAAKGYQNILTRTRQQLDLSDQTQVNRFLQMEQPEFVIDAAARVGGILANNTYRGDFILENLQIQNNLIGGAHRAGIERLLFLGSSCIYPRDCAQPIKEEYLLTGPLEETNKPYAIAKIAGIELCNGLNAQHGRKYLSVMPTNLYGPGDNFDPKTGHVLPALVRRFHEAKVANAPSVTIWGSGTPRREFLYVDDLADACIHLLEKSDTTELLNIGTGKDITILELAQLIAEVVGFEGSIELDRSKPDGTPRKLLDVFRLQKQGWVAQTSLREGITLTYEWFIANGR
jgi:GDP-L-fucose synthase